MTAMEIAWLANSSFSFTKIKTKQKPPNRSLTGFASFVVFMQDLFLAHGITQLHEI